MRVYGTVQVNGANVPPGTLVTARCAEGLAGQDTSFVEKGSTWYAIDVRAGGGESAGCYAGEAVQFRIDTLSTPQTTTWTSGRSAQVPLTSTFSVEATKLVSTDGVNWHDADTLDQALAVERDTALTWRIAVTNTSAVTVDLWLTDTLDSDPLNLASLCDQQLPANLTPVGESGSAFACEITDTSEAGTHRNKISARISAGNWVTTSVNYAYYEAPQLKVYLPLVLR